MHVTQTVDLCTVFWNTWLHNELKAGNDSPVCTRLGELIKVHQPDFFGLSEILWDKSTNTSRILDFLSSHGYYTHFTNFHDIPQSDHYILGSAIASLQKPLDIQEYPLSQDETRRQLSIAILPLPPTDSTIQVAVMHPAPLPFLPHSGGHAQQIKTLRHLMNTMGTQERFIMGGDLNQFSWQPRLWLDKAHFNHRTGSWAHPTWRWRGHVGVPIRASLDHLFWSRDQSVNLHSFEVLDRRPSDHSPLLARFKIKI